MALSLVTFVQLPRPTSSAAAAMMMKAMLLLSVASLVSVADAAGMMTTMYADNVTTIQLGLKDGDTCAADVKETLMVPPAGWDCDG